MSISQFFILSLRGDTIIYRNFRKDLNKGINEVFFRKVNFFQAEEKAPPIFNVDGINFIHVKTNELYLVLVTLDNFSPNYFIEILGHLMKVIKDHCGILTEESIRKNFVLIYEIIDEMIDFGVPQLCSTEQIKPFVFNEPVRMTKSENSIIEIMNKNTTSGKATEKPQSQFIDSKSKENKIYVDVIEKITALFNSSGKLLIFSVDGCIKMKSYLHGNPEIKLVLNDDVSIGKSGYGACIEDCNFHSRVNPREFESNKTLYISSPDGEFVAMNYRINSSFTPPFQIYANVREEDYKLELKIKIQGNYSDKFAANVLIKFNVPKSSQNVYFDIAKNKQRQKADYLSGDKICTWTIPKLQGGSEHKSSVIPPLNYDCSTVKE